MNDEPQIEEEPVIPTFSIVAARRMERSNAILDFIQKNSPTNTYQVSKRMKLTYSTVQRTVEQLNFCGLVNYEISVTADNKLIKKLTSIKKKEEIT